MACLPTRTALAATFAPVLALIAMPASAHVFGAHGAGLGDGLAHPFAGPDHLCAMIAVGLWAAQLGGRALWAVPMAFIGTMALGAVAGGLGLGLPMVEPGIAASLVVLGILVASAVHLPVWIGGLIIATFALFHGHAHGSEFPETGHWALYGLGFLAATALLHALGIGIGLAGRARLAGKLVRIAGALVAMFGFALLTGLAEI